MNKQLQIVLLVGLVTNAYSQYYWSTVNTCPLGQYPACDSNSLPGASTTTGAPSANQSCLVCPKGSAAMGSSATYNYWYMNGNGLGCQICSQGYYQNKTGQAYCNPCPEGYSCADPTKDPVPCPKGFACSKVWSIDSMNGYNNYYWGQSVVKVCPQGTYNNKMGQGQCVTCPAGYYCADPTTAPVACRPGTASNAYGYGMYNGGCQQCPQGTYTWAYGSANCLPCPEGSICPDQTKAIKCPVGTYSHKVYKVTFPMNYDSNSNMYSSVITCERCPQGYYATTAGSKTCTKCPKGYYCSDPTVSPKPCPAGTFANLEYGVQSCIRCPPGSYATATASKQCTICPKGSYCADPTKLPIKCPIGTFSNSTFGQSLCTPCPLGTYASTIGAVQCTVCPINKCCNDPTINPQPCYFPSSSTPLYPYTSYQSFST